MSSSKLGHNCIQSCTIMTKDNFAQYCVCDYSFNLYAAPPKTIIIKQLLSCNGLSFDFNVTGVQNPFSFVFLRPEDKNRDYN